MKSSDDLKRERELLSELLELVQRRSFIVDSLEEERVRYLLILCVLLHEFVTNQKTCYYSCDNIVTIISLSDCEVGTIIFFMSPFAHFISLQLLTKT